MPDSRGRHSMRGIVPPPTTSSSIATAIWSRGTSSPSAASMSSAQVMRDTNKPGRESRKLVFSPCVGRLQLAFVLSVPNGQRNSPCIHPTDRHRGRRQCHVYHLPKFRAERLRGVRCRSRTRARWLPPLSRNTSRSERDVGGIHLHVQVVQRRVPQRIWASVHRRVMRCWVHRLCPPRRRRLSVVGRECRIGHVPPPHLELRRLPML